MTVAGSMSKSVEQAQRLLTEGRMAEAHSAFAAILERDPENAEALNFMALAALRGGDLTRALALIEKARLGGVVVLLTLYNHGRILAAAERHEEAIGANREALRFAPNLHAARLNLGQALERAGQPRQAVVAYARALQDAHSAGRWLNPDTSPVAFRPVVELAVRQVQQLRRAMLAHLLAPLVERYGRD